jgi:hypothetical protein
MLIVSGSYQNFENGAVIVSNQLTESGREKSVLRVTVNLLTHGGGGVGVVQSTLYTNCHFLASIPSLWKN